MFIIQLLVVLAMLSGSGSSSYATSTQMEIKSLQPQTASSELIMESGLKPFRAERDFKNLDPFEQAAKNLREKLYNSYSNSSPLPSKVGDTEPSPYGGKVKLLRTLPLDQTISLGPLAVYLVNVQLLEATEIPEDTQKDISTLNQEKIGSTITYIRVLYSVENTTNRNVGFYGLNSVHPNMGNPISSDRNFLRDTYVYHQYDGVVIDNFENGFVYTDDPGKLESIKLVFNEIYDYDTEETIVEPTSLTIPFNE
jgi:hypothetical protein